MHNNFDTTWEDFCNDKEGICSPVSINSDYLSDDISFIYDHSTNSININASNLPIKYISLYNTNGQLIKNYRVSTANNSEVDVDGLANGLYVILAIVRGQLIQAKLAITR